MYTFRLLDFVVKDEKREAEVDSDDETTKKYQDTMKFSIQLFGLDEQGKTYCAHVEQFSPFFFVKIPDTWKQRHLVRVEEWMKDKLLRQKGSTFYHSSILSTTLVKQKTLYGFDAGKYYNFAKIEFANTRVMNLVKRFWYEDGKLIEGGVEIAKQRIQLYEANILPLLRFFHFQNISPSGWVQVDPTHCIQTRGNHEGSKMTTCEYEFTVAYDKIQSLPQKETVVPYTICSFDIEASSSHGDFPLPIKTYKKLATDILDYWDDHDEEHREFLENLDRDDQHSILEIILLVAFREPLSITYRDCESLDEDEYQELLNRIHVVYPKKHARPSNIAEFRKRIQRWMETPVKLLQESLGDEKETIKELLKGDIESHDIPNKFKKNYVKKNDTILDLLNDRKFDREDKMKELTLTLNASFPPLEGDYVTYIGSTFWRYGETEPYLNHCIALGECDAVDGAQIDCYDTEREVLLAWTNLIQKENPDILIGYNIFGFDYQYMFSRAKENRCVNQFLRLSRNRGEVCGNEDYKTGEMKIKEKELVIASGTHQLKYIHMPGRIQIDLYNYFRRDYNLTSYKLDYVSGYFIGDKVSRIENLDGKTKIHSKNLTGLNVGNFVNFEEIAHSSDMYEDGKKFYVCEVGDKWFMVDGIVTPNMSCVVKWGLAKDDVTPQDIFAMSNGTIQERATIAKYCIQDCNLVHHLLRKIDVVTGMVEMAKICSVPLEFLIMRGQGIKLFSFVAKQCRERDTLIPVIEKVNDGSYEGAIVLVPKSGLYLDEPVACVDYSSLYPSSMISENISHDSKVWTREYTLDGKLIKETGEKNDNGEYIYDNLEGYEYVDIEYDTYEYIPNARGKEEKTLTGKKVCRFAQFPDGKAIMPEILSDLLKARKNTRKSAKWKTVTLHHEVNGRLKIMGTVLDTTETTVTLTDKFGSPVVIERSAIASMEDTFNDFMKNVLDKRQLAIKVTANSLYGQCGARTSSFYEKDIAASTTATGRKLLTYGKRIIEEVYGDSTCETSMGPVKTRAEYIYGDSVTGDTPLLMRKRNHDNREGNKETYNVGIYSIKTLGEPYRGVSWTPYEEFKPFDTYESNRRDKQQCLCEDMEVWTASGWSKIKRVIRHRCNKAIYRVITPHGLADVTEDHSLLDASGKIVKPTELTMTTPLLHHEYSSRPSFMTYPIVDNQTMWESSLDKMKLANLFHNPYRVMNYQFPTQGHTLVQKLYDVDNEGNLKDNGEYDGFVYDLETEDGTFNTGFSLIVKNTDSVFMSFKLRDIATDEPIRGKKALEMTIELAKEAGELATKFLKAPHDLEYEKTFMPFCLLSKKRYVGMLYEEDPNKCYRKSMGIVLKRRDNAPIVKDVYGGIIDILMKEQNIQSAIEFTRNCLQDIVNEKYPLEKLVITKSLRGFYKNPSQIAHKVLADRMGKRDPGNKPSPGDRIPFVYIQTKTKMKLQGDRIEHPDYIRKHGLKPDYSHYITNQIMKPVLQVFALVMEQIPGYNKRIRMKYEDTIRTMSQNMEPEKFEKKRQDMREAIVKQLVFDDALRISENAKKGNRAITSFFKKH